MFTTIETLLVQQQSCLSFADVKGLVMLKKIATWKRDPGFRNRS